MKNKVLIISILLLPFLGKIAYAQREKNKKNYTVNVNDNDRHLSVKVDVMANRGNIIPDKNLVYYWYTSNKIMETQGGYEGKLLHGQYTSFYLNNQLKEKGKFIKGLKDGKWVLWNPDGRIKEMIHWRKGLKNGKLETYNDQGEKIVEANFKHNVYHGYVILYQEGKMISRKRYKMGKEVLPNARKADKRSTLKERKDTSSTGVKRSWKETFRSLFPQKKETVTEQKNSSSLDVIPPQKSKGIREKKKKDQVPSSQK